MITYGCGFFFWGGGRGLCFVLTFFVFFLFFSFLLFFLFFLFFFLVFVSFCLLFVQSFCLFLYFPFFSFPFLLTLQMVKGGITRDAFTKKSRSRGRGFLVALQGRAALHIGVDNLVWSIILAVLLLKGGLVGPFPLVNDGDLICLAQRLVECKGSW